MPTLALGVRGGAKGHEVVAWVDMGKEWGTAHAGDMSGAWGHVDEAQDMWAALGGCGGPSSMWHGHGICGGMAQV